MKRKYGLADYMAENPQELPQEDIEAAEEAARTFREEAEALEEVQQIKRTVLHQLEAGCKPQQILYSLLPAVGLLTDDSAWTDAARAILEDIYLAEELTEEGAAAKADRLISEQRRGYAGKVRKRLELSLKNTQALEDAITKALDALSVPELPESWQ